MTMTEAVRTVLSKYATMSGRAGRAEFWWWILATLIASAVANLLDYLLFGSDSFYRPIGTILGLLILIPDFTVTVRRLHDTDRTAWWLLLTLVPVVGWLVLIYFYIQRGTPGPNRFGLAAEPPS